MSQRLIKETKIRSVDEESLPTVELAEYIAESLNSDFTVVQDVKSGEYYIASKE